MVQRYENNAADLIFRVYGIIANAAGEVLLMHEKFVGKWIWKFPGGGWEPGEGVIDTLRREIQEELGVQAWLYRHFYTTQYFQPSFAHSHAQIIAVYYQVQLRQKNFVLPPQACWWNLQAIELPLPIDKVVQRRLLRIFPDGKVVFSAR